MAPPSQGPIAFEPQEHTAYNTTLYLRNNLTTLHPVMLNGVGGSGRLVFRDGAMDFNLTEADLGAESLGDEPRRRVAISKSFVATNDCELPVEVGRVWGSEPGGESLEGACWCGLSVV